jgi:hypothetical protein
MLKRPGKNGRCPKCAGNKTPGPWDRGSLSCRFDKSGVVGFVYQPPDFRLAAALPLYGSP